MPIPSLNLFPAATIRAHTKNELTIWKSASIEPAGDWYVSAGAGMGDVLKMADEKQAYTIADRATYLAMQNDMDLVVLCEKRC